MSKEIKELKEEIKALKQRINGLERDLDYQIHQNSNNAKLADDVKDLQEAVASMANQPVGMIFDYRA